jgi:hypothetical protein
MKERIKPQLPGDILVALRESEGFYSHREFADTLAMSPTTLWRLEGVTWGSLPSSWSRPVKRSDLTALVVAGWIREGDAWWERFRTAFAWQHLVCKYGKEIYEDGGASLRILAPISEEHVFALVEAMVTREVMRRAGLGRASSEDREQILIDRLYAELVLRLATMDYILTVESDTPITPDSEQTRGLSDLIVSGAAETPYIRTLLFAYEWADEELSRLVDVPE